MVNELKSNNDEGIEELINSSLDIEDAVMEVDSKQNANEEVEIAEADESILSEPVNVDSIPETEIAGDEVTDTISSEDLGVDVDKPDLSEVEQVEHILVEAGQEVDGIETVVEPEDANDEGAELDQGSVEEDFNETLENEVAELEAEILVQMDKLAERTDSLKENIKNELQRVTESNEGFQQQVDDLKGKLSDAEEKIEILTQVQDRQQITIKKLIRILRNVNLKISDLYDEK